MKNNLRCSVIILILLISFFTQGVTYKSYASEVYMGEIHLFSFDFAPRGWAKCEGQLIPIQQNTALFSLIGTTFGGNGTTNFALPDLRTAAVQFENSPQPMCYYIALSGLFPSRP